MNWFRNILLTLRPQRASLKRLSTDGEGKFIPPPPSLTWKQIWSYPPLVLGTLIVIGLIFIIWFAPALSLYDPYLVTQSVRPHYDVINKVMIVPPFPRSPQNPLGTDQWGNDLLSLVLYGARVTLIAGLYITLGRIIAGTVLGLLSGWYASSFFDRMTNGVGTVIGSVPVLLSSIIFLYALNIYEGLWVFIVGLTAVGWFETTQLVRGEVMRIKHTSYVEAAKAIGLNNFQIVIRHVLPNVLAYLIVITVLEMGAVMLLLAELAFLGVFIGGGTRYNDDPFSPRIVLLREVPEWGAMVAQGVRYIRAHPLMVLVPGFAFFISIAGVNALGEGLRWLFTRWPFSTAILLKRRTVILVGTIVVLSAVILNQTSPQASFANVSRQITAENVQSRIDMLMEMREKNPDEAGKVIADYVANQMNEQEFIFGWRSGLHPAYHYDYETTVRPILSTPKLASLSVAGQPSRSFAYQTDFVLAQDQPMESISMTGDLMLVNPQAENEIWSFDGHVVMTLRSLTPVNFSQFVASHGGTGLLLIADNPILPCARPGTNYPVKIKYFEIRTFTEFSINRLMPVEGDPQPFPTLILTPEAAASLMATDGLGLDIFTSTDWALRKLSSSVSIDLAFGEGETIPVYNAIGYLGGYDIDNAHETVLLYAPYDTSTGKRDDLLSVALMLEMIRAWHDHNLDPRRSVMLIAWDRSSNGSPGAQAFIDERDNYRLLTPAVPAANSEPIMVWDLSMQGNLHGDMGVAQSSNPLLQDLLKDAGRDFRAGMVINRSTECQPDPTVSLPYLSLMPAESGMPSDDFIEDFGRSVSLAVLKILRLPKY